MRLLQDRLVAWRSQHSTLVFRVGYTVMSLWLLAHPMVEGEAHELHPTATEAAVSQTLSDGLSHPTQREGSVGDRPDAWETDSAGASGLLTPEQARARLQTLVALPRNPHSSDAFAVHTSVLCFCLDKGPATVRELRRLAGDWYDRGLRALQAYDYATAVTAFTQALQRSPRDARAYVNRGLAYARLENYQSAMADQATPELTSIVGLPMPGWRTTRAPWQISRRLSTWHLSKPKRITFTNSLPFSWITPPR